MKARLRHPGFTLIELSIVLVIIGLIVGGVLVGQDLIAAAAIRGQVSQIEKFQTATHTFQTKYGELPGDLDNNVAVACGFQTGRGAAGSGNNDGILQGYGGIGFLQWSGETAVFWSDLSAANLIPGSFTTALTSAAFTGTANPDLFLPPSPLGNKNYVYVYSTTGGVNYFAVSSGPASLSPSQMISNPGMSPLQAFSIDTKIDDGYPQTGNVVAEYIGYGAIAWVPNHPFGGYSAPGDTSATAGSTATCYDNSASPTGTPGVAGNQQHYSMEIGGGTNVNCALSFRFQ